MYLNEENICFSFADVFKRRMKLYLLILYCGAAISFGVFTAGYEHYIPFTKGKSCVCVQFISLCTSYISGNITYIFELCFCAMLVTIIGLSGLFCICERGRGIYQLGESILEGEGKVIGLVHL